MKTIQVTDEQIKVIEQALDFAYNSSLKVIETNRQILSDKIIENIIQEANKFIDVQEVFNVKETDISNAEKFVLETIEGCEPETHPNGDVVWRKDGKWLFEQDFENGYLFVSYKYIWSILGKKFGLNDDEILELLTKVLYNYMDNGKLKICL